MANETPFTGLTALVKIGTGEQAKNLAYISGCTLNLDKDIIEILQFGAQFKEKVPAIKDWSLDVDGTVAFATGGTQEELYNAYSNGTALTLGIYLNATTYFEGTGYVQSISIDAAPDDKINLSASMAGSGAVTLTLPTGA